MSPDFIFSSSTAPHPVRACQISIKGTVQGVGFRPFVYRLAQEEKLAGTVANTSSGVRIIAAGEQAQLERFIARLEHEAPPLATIDQLVVEPANPPADTDFRILESGGGSAREVILPPDISLCHDCRREILDPADRRYHYPLNNCTNCGPRYTIIRDLPYDREQTAMAPYPFCPECLAEYTDPGDRRFHAEATSCPQCGPGLRLMSGDGRDLPTAEPLARLAESIRSGGIVALQGLGGFHIICDARNTSTVEELRRRKRRPHKPFAVMVKDLEMAADCAVLDVNSRSLLDSPQRPIVIVPERYACSRSVTAGLDRIGLFLPYTPLHLLLFEHLDGPIVATSANLSDEPIITDRRQLLADLPGVIDELLCFDRKIINGCDDSVVTPAGATPLLLRRARGYAPARIKLPGILPQRILAVGGGMKNTIAIGMDNQTILSPHIGDLEGAAAEDYFVRTIETFQRIYDFKPDLLVCDSHPEYLSTRWAERQGLPLTRVQHHYAHALAGMTACGLGPETEILAVCWDGTGYGADGSLWGGEFLECSYRGYRRHQWFRPLPLLGAEKAIREPRRVALGLLFELYGEAALEFDHPCLCSFTGQERQILWTMYQKGLNAPKTTSVGRLFDAAAALLGICQTLSYEGQSGLLMEAYFDPDSSFRYPFTIDAHGIDCRPAVAGMLTETDPIRGVSGFINMLVEIILTVLKTEGRREALLSGGVFQNARLVERLSRRAGEERIRLHIPTTVPVNDGCIALGQIASCLYPEHAPTCP